MNQPNPRQALLEQLIRGQIDQATYERRLAELDRRERSGAALRGAGGPGPRGPAERPPQVPPPQHGPPADRIGAARRAASDDVIQSGNLLDGRFKVRDRLGKGGMGEVWRAYDTIADVQVVVKVLPRALQNDPQEIARVQQAFRRVNPLQHQHICPVHHLAYDPLAGYFLVMKFLDGTTLREYHRAHARGGRMSVSEVCRVLRPVAEALDYAHANGVVHRDIKPDNIMLTHAGGDPQIVDFGLAADAQAAGATSDAGSRGGTLPYLAPEQWQKQHAGPPSDQYALGIVAYELLAGRLPFAERDPRLLKQQVLSAPVPLIAGLPQEVQIALGRALAKSPRDRYANCIEFLKGLEAVRAPTLPPNLTPGAAGTPAVAAPPMLLPVGAPSGVGGAPAGRSPGLTGEMAIIPPNLGNAPSPSAALARGPGTSGEAPVLPTNGKGAAAIPPLAMRPPAKLSSGETPALPFPSPQDPLAAAPATARERGSGWLALGLLGTLAVGGWGVWRYLLVEPSPASGLARAVTSNEGGTGPARMGTGGYLPADPALEGPATPEVKDDPTAASDVPADPPGPPTAGGSGALPAQPAAATAELFVNSPRLLLGRSQLFQYLVPWGLTIDLLKGAQWRSEHGRVTVTVDSAQLVEGITYTLTDPTCATDRLIASFPDRSGTPCEFTVELEIDPQRGPIARSALVRLNVASNLASPAPAAGVTTPAAATNGPVPAPPSYTTPPLTTAVGPGGSSPVRRTVAASWGEHAQPLSRVWNLVDVKTVSLPPGDLPWLSAAPYQKDDGGDQLHFALYAPDGSALGLRSEATRATIVEFSPLLGSSRDVVSLNQRPGNPPPLHCTWHGAPTGEVTRMLRQALVRVVGANDAAVLLQAPVENTQEWKVYWKGQQRIAVPGSVPHGLRWRLFVRFRPWNAAQTQWTEIVPVRKQASDSLRYIYDGYEPPDSGRRYGAYEYPVHLADLSFIVEPEGSLEAPTEFTVGVQGVRSGWLESYNLKRAALRQTSTEPADRRQLTYELQVLDAVTSDQAGQPGPGSGFTACLIGYETWDGPRTLGAGETGLDRSDRIDVARCVLGTSLTSATRLLVREASPAEPR